MTRPEGERVSPRGSTGKPTEPTERFAQVPLRLDRTLVERGLTPDEFYVLVHLILRVHEAHWKSLTAEFRLDELRHELGWKLTAWRKSADTLSRVLRSLAAKHWIDYRAGKGRKAVHAVRLTGARVLTRAEFLRRSEAGSLRSFDDAESAGANPDSAAASEEPCGVPGDESCGVPAEIPVERAEFPPAANPHEQPSSAPSDDEQCGFSLDSRPLGKPLTEEGLDANDVGEGTRRSSRLRLDDFEEIERRARAAGKLDLGDQIERARVAASRLPDDSDEPLTSRRRDAELVEKIAAAERTSRRRDVGHERALSSAEPLVPLEARLDLLTETFNGTWIDENRDDGPPPTRVEQVAPGIELWHYEEPDP